MDQETNGNIIEQNQNIINEEKNNNTNVVKKPSVKTKEELIYNIKEWIKLESEIKKISSDLKEKKAKMTEITHNLVDVMKTNSIDCFDINGGALVYKKKTNKKQISGKFLMAQLEEYFREQPDVAKDIHKKVWDNREIAVKEEIKRQKPK